MAVTALPVTFRATATPRAPVRHGFDDLVLAGAAWVLVGCCAWAALVGAAALVERVLGGRLPVTAWVGCPPLVRRALLGGLGVALAGSPLAPASGSSLDVPGPAPDVRVGATAGLPLPERATGGASAGGPAGRFVVRRGDTLWSLASRRLPGASDATVAAAVRRLHAANRGVIGPDPDLLVPGQRLRDALADPSPTRQEQQP